MNGVCDLLLEEYASGSWIRYSTQCVHGRSDAGLIKEVQAGRLSAYCLKKTYKLFSNSKIRMHNYCLFCIVAMN